ncbi:hypothetical protein NUW58_g3424 [Xylaria curta]|uniref:Uncharacterized protein n=1 Tax=Xylaria curta TaxID=42375 RepID=A0ACC1PAZ7_9PEZI|nr:hypothetical protein NUW58_g3424 [Xylaria curta]
MMTQEVALAAYELGNEIQRLMKDEEYEEETFQTDLHRWRLRAVNGRHTWVYLEDAEEVSQHPHQTFREIYWLGLNYEEAPEKERDKEFPSNTSQPGQRQETLNALKRGSSFLRQLQMEDGSWGSNCDGPMFITVGIVFACYIVGIPLPQPLKREMCRYLINTRNRGGGWGVYLKGPSTVFGTAINYVMLRVLGLGPGQSVCRKARDLLNSMGGVLGIPTWGRFWLCVLNLYDWDGIVPLPAELLLTPRGFPLNPANWWMPIRNIYMGMCYLYGHRFQAPEDHLIRALRDEIYASQPYKEITHWPALRSYVNPIDLVKAKSPAQSAMVSAMGFWESFARFPIVNSFRSWGLDEALFQVEADVCSTEYCSYLPAYWSVYIIVLRQAHGADSHWVRGMTPHFADGLWMGTLTRMQGYIVSDVTAETLMAILQGHRVRGLSTRIPLERLQLAVDPLIGLECGGSGFAAYELVRGWEMIELCNITDTYEDCMIERRYAETTGAVMMALTEFHAEQPEYRREDIRRCIKGGASHLLSTQDEHGGWRGAWGVCFTFATMWALQGLACAGYTKEGGWGESLESYQAKDYVAAPEGSQVTNTAYAVIGLLAARCDRAAIERGVGYLTKSQRPNGEWLNETLEAIYTPPCGARYPLYKFHFPLKALAYYARRYGIKALKPSPHVLIGHGQDYDLIK